MGSRPCGRSSRSRPDCHRRRICATRREATVTGFDCGAGCSASPALSHRLGGFVPIWLTACSSEFSCAEPSRATGGSKMTLRPQEWASRKLAQRSRGAFRCQSCSAVGERRLPAAPAGHQPHRAGSSDLDCSAPRCARETRRAACSDSSNRHQTRTAGSLACVRESHWRGQRHVQPSQRRARSSRTVHRRDERKAQAAPRPAGPARLGNDSLARRGLPALSHNSESPDAP